MGFGIALGGAAKGLESAEQAFARKRSLDLQQQNILQDQDLRERALGIQERQLEQSSQNDLMTQVKGKIDEHEKFALGIIENARKSNAPLDKLGPLLEPILESVDTLGSTANVDTSGVRQRVGVALNAPASAPSTSFEGTGMEQQSSNVVMGVAEKIRLGQPISARDKDAYALAYAKITEPKVVGSPSTGFSLVQPQLDPNVFPPPGQLGAPRDPQATPEQGGTEPTAPTVAGQQEAGGATITQLTGKQKTAEQAGRAALVSEGTKTIRSIRDAIIDESGNVDRALILSMTTDIPLLGKGVPFSDGRKFRSQMEDASSAKLRLETGAQANAEEIQGIIDRFMPSNLDSDDGVRDKLDRMISFFNTSLADSDPELFNKLTERSRQKGNIPDPPEGEEGSEFQGFDGASGVAVFKRKDGTFFGMPVEGN